MTILAHKKGSSENDDISDVTSPSIPPHDASHNSCPHGNKRSTVVCLATIAFEEDDDVPPTIPWLEEIHQTKLVHLVFKEEDVIPLPLFLQDAQPAPPTLGKSCKGSRFSGFYLELATETNSS